jgi:N-acetylglucosamine kinase-like BadF-type ATPase
MRYVIGVDGSSNGTTAVLVDSRGNLLGAGVSGTTFERDFSDPSRFQRGLSDAILGALTMAEMENARISAACVNLPLYHDRLKGVLAACVRADLISLGIHSHVALNTISLGAAGVVVLADDNVEAYGINCRHEGLTAGGWNRPGGDDGSGRWIANRAISICCDASDGIGPQTLLLPMLLRHLELQELRDLVRKSQTGLSPADEIAINDMVNAAAAQGDASARRLLREAGKHLGGVATALIDRLQMQACMPVVGTVGSVFRAGRLVLKSFRETVHKSVPHCKIIGQQAPACVGAAISALEDIGVEMQDAMVNTMRAGLPGLTALRVRK